MPRSEHEPSTTIFETDHGAVRRCQCGGCLLVRYGHCLLSVGVGGLRELRAAIVGAARETSGRRGSGEPVVLYIADTGAGFVFAPDEVGELHRLLDGAQLMLDLAGGGERPRPPSQDRPPPRCPDN